MSSAHGPEILSGSADKKPHGTFGRLLHDHEKRYFVLRLGAGGVPELAYATPLLRNQCIFCNILTRYYEGGAADDKHQKGVLYLDHSSVSVTIDKSHNELQISNASKGSHHGFHHVVQDLMMHFSSLAELEKWHAALTNCLHPQPQAVKQDAAAAPRHETRKVKINIVYYSTYAVLINHHLRPALHTDSRSHLCD